MLSSLYSCILVSFLLPHILMTIMILVLCKRKKKAVTCSSTRKSPAPSNKVEPPKPSSPSAQKVTKEIDVEMPAELQEEATQFSPLKQNSTIRQVRQDLIAPFSGSDETNEDAESLKVLHASVRSESFRIPGQKVKSSKKVKEPIKQGKEAEPKKAAKTPANVKSSERKRKSKNANKSDAIKKKNGTKPDPEKVPNREQMKIDRTVESERDTLQSKESEAKLQATPDLSREQEA